MKEIISLFIKRKEFFFNLLIQHIEISFISIILAIFIGGIIGIVIAENKKSAKPTLNIINFLYTIPSISMLGFLIPFSGVGNTTAIIALVIYALLPMVRNTYTGISQVDNNMIEAAKAMGSTRNQILWKIKIPLAMPVILSGIKSMITMTIALTGIASFIGAGGLGVAIYRGITTNNSAMTFIGSLLIAILAVVVEFIFNVLEKYVNKRKRIQKKYSLIFIVLILCLLARMIPQKKDTLKIATKPMTEQYILGEMLTLYIEQETNLQVEVTQGVGGGTSNIEPALEKGEFDMYPEYTGTGWNMVLKNEGNYDESMFKKLQKGYQRKGLEWQGMYGFNNTYGLAVRKDIADQYQLKTYSDLKNISNQLIFGAEYDFFEREDGYDALCKTYNLNFKETMDMDIGLKYQALNQGKVDVMTIFTTDGQLSNDQIVVLEDDQHFYPSYMCGNVVRSDVLKKHPELKKVLKKLSYKINDLQMAKMNDFVESKGKEPKEVAKSYLKKLKLLKESAMEPIIEFKDIKKDYDKNVVIPNLNLSINKGEFITIIGTSGSGKTTVLKIMNGLIEPTSGMIQIHGKDIKKQNLIQLRRKMGYVIQGSMLFPHLTVKQNIAYVPQLEKKKVDHQLIEEWLQKVQLDPSLKDKYPSELSGGQQQRVAIARGLIHQPDILLMDEPFGAVDEITRRQLQDEILKIYQQTKTTILFVTHDIQEALKLGTRVLIMDQGTIQQFDTPEHIVKDPANDYVKRLILHNES